jgi:rRNA maturation protein Nop10
MGVGGQRHAPAALPPVMTRYLLYSRLGRPQGRSGRVLKISLPPRFDPPTVYLVASRYTDYDIPYSKHGRNVCNAA